MMRCVVLTVLAACLSLNAGVNLAGFVTPSRTAPERLPAPAVADDTIGGYYFCSGKISPDGNPYDGAVLVEPIDKTYAVRWTIQGGGTMQGTGIREGDTLVVGCRTSSGSAVVRYKIDIVDGKPRLTGRWASIPGNGDIHHEVLTFVRPLVKREE
jgi:hypothetical protein